MKSQLQRDAADGAHVVCHVVSGLAVTTGGGVGEFSVAVEQGDRHPVDLWLDGDGDVRPLQVLLEALVEVDELLLRAGGTGLFHGLGAEFENIIDAEHGHRVADLLEALDGIAADAQGGGVRVVELRVFFLKILQLAEELVVLRIGDFRGGLVVIEPVVVVELGTEFADARFRSGGWMLGKQVKLGHGGSLVRHAEFSRQEWFAGIVDDWRTHLIQGMTRGPSVMLCESGREIIPLGSRFLREEQ